MVSTGKKLKEVVFDPTRGFVYEKESGKFLGKPARDYNRKPAIMNSEGKIWEIRAGYVDNFFGFVETDFTNRNSRTKLYAII